mmetsp:Transcript_74556/g.207175  ORF Transcript_74556/g.207175 Transcript_74556/m.207175 type:complete len:202 (-) Transcript_74556:366-971(-)
MAFRSPSPAGALDSTAWTEEQEPPPRLPIGRGCCGHLPRAGRAWCRARTPLGGTRALLRPALERPRRRLPRWWLTKQWRWAPMRRRAQWHLPTAPVRRRARGVSQREGSQSTMRAGLVHLAAAPLPRRARRGEVMREALPCLITKHPGSKWQGLAEPQKETARCRPLTSTCSPCSTADRGWTAALVQTAVVRTFPSSSAAR